MGRKVKKQEGLRRVAAVLMAVAMVLSVMPVEPGLFSITVNAAEKLSAVWTTADSVLKDTNNTEADSVKGGTLTNNNGNVIDISDANTFTKRTSNGDFLVNGGVELSLPVVSKAKTCTITLVSYNDITSDSHSITVDGMKDTSISKSGSGWLTYTITGTPDGSGNTVTIKTNNQEFFRRIEVNSSSSLAVTDAAFADGHMSAEWRPGSGSYLSSTWLPFESNRFLRRLKERKGQFEFRIEEDLENYLNAYDIYMRANEGWKNQCIKLLRKSIDNSSMVNNYILLSKLVERGEARKLIKIAEENRTIQIENKENGGINEICDPWKYINCEIKGYQ